MVGTVSCSSDDDINMWDATYVYLMPEHLGIYTTEFDLTHKGSNITGPETKIQFYVALNRAVDNDVTVDLSLATSKTLDMEKVNLSSASVTIPAGQLKSEPITMSVEDWSSETTIKTEVKYSADVKLGNVQTKDVFAGTQNKLGMAITKSTLLNLEVGVPAESALIENRAEWDITIDESAENASNPQRLIDGNNTDIAKNNAGFWITVDLKKPTLVTGIKTSFWGSYYAARFVEVLVSDNGSKWESQGKLRVSGSPQDVKLVEPITTQYIKYNIITPFSNRLSVTEFNVYAK